MGFKEINHTADWALEVSGEDLETLFIEAARGMYALMSAQSLKSSRRGCEFSTIALDPEARLVSFLNELLYFAEQENILFDSFDLIFAENTFSAKMEGSEIISIQKLIKAVTFHNLIIKHKGNEFHVKIVFDV
jgi:SHS2 domain-containing protein